MNIRQKCKKLKNENGRLRNITNVSYNKNYIYLQSRPVTLMLTDKVNPEELEFYIKTMGDDKSKLAKRFSEMIGPNIDTTIYYPDIFTSDVTVEHKLTIFRRDISDEEKVRSDIYGQNRLGKERN